MDKRERQQWGARVAKERKARGLTQRQLADLVGVNERTIGNIENAVTSTSPATMFRIEQALSIDPDPERTKSVWPEDVQIFLDVVGAWLSTLSYEDRKDRMARITRQIVGRNGAESATDQAR